jgi:hypothetical protein
MRDQQIEVGSRLVDFVIRGELLDLAGEEQVDESAMRSWDHTRTVQADVIRDILRGRLALTPDPHGLRLRGARIAGRLDLDNLTTSVGLELFDCFLPQGLVARDASMPALILHGCILEHSVQPPLAADRLCVTSDVSLDKTLITAHAEAGALRLPGAHIGGQLGCANVKIHNESGPALFADSLQVDQSVFLSEGFEAIGTGNNGAVRLLGAHIGGQLNCPGAKIHNKAGPALDAEGLRVDQSVFLSDGFEAVGTGNDGVLRLAGAHIGGVLAFSPEGVQNTSDSRARLAVDGLTYSGIPFGLSVDGWLSMLREGTPAYAAQPYQHLAAAHRAAGHDSEARTILIEQRRHQVRSRALAGRGARAWTRLTGLTLGYGYQPWRALIGLLAILTASVALCLLTTGALAHTKNSPRPDTACTTVERIGVGLDLGLPLIKTGARTQCDLTTTPAGQWLTVSSWGLQVLAWAFATLFIAGFTGAVRKT